MQLLTKIRKQKYFDYYSRKPKASVYKFTQWTKETTQLHKALLKSFEIVTHLLKDFKRRVTVHYTLVFSFPQNSTSTNLQSLQSSLNNIFQQCACESGI